MAKRNLKEKEELFSQVASEITETEVDDYIEKNFLPYAWSVAVDRALVFVEDGLKPIQRRILYTAYREGVTDKSSYMKSATFAGKVMAYSPHADCYSSIVNIAAPEIPGQPRNLRVPLIKGKGNWGGIDSPAASSRYTEMKLQPAAMELLEELKENAVDMVPNYNSTDVEPKYLPARWPVAFINGCTDAMAVGFASNMPCHNPNEVMDACIALEKDKTTTVKKLEKIIKAPDFDCGCDIIPQTEQNGELVDGVKQYLETGSGSFLMRGRYDVSEENGRKIITFYALPYKISPTKVVEELNKAYDAGQFQELSSWKDLSDIDTPTKLEITTKRAVNLDKLMTDLFAKTSLQKSFAANNTIIIDLKPVQADVKTILLSFVEFREECTRRKLNFRLEKNKSKLKMQEAIKSVLVDIDECIAIIRKSKDRPAAKSSLMKKFGLDEEQAEYVLSLSLGRLTKSDVNDVIANIKSLKASIKEITQTLKDTQKFTDFVVSEMEATKQVISSERKCRVIKTDITDEPAFEDKPIEVKGNKIFAVDSSDIVAKNSEIGILDSKGYLHLVSIAHLAQGKSVSFASLGVKGGVCAVVPGQYLLIVGEQGSVKLGKIDELQDTEVFKFPVKCAFSMTDIDNKKLVLHNGKTQTLIELTELPLKSLTAKNGKRFTSAVDDVELMTY